MGPLATLFGYLYDQNRPARVNALRARLNAGDDGGPVILDDSSGLVPQGMALPYQDITQGPPPPTPRFRDPEQAGPAPPSKEPLAAMFPKKKKNRE